MNPAIATLAYLFYVVAFVLFAPGVAYLAFDWTRRLRARFAPRPGASTSVENPDAVLLLLEGLVKGAGALGKVGGFIGEIVAGLLAGLALAAVLVSLLLFFTARGLLHQQPWAWWSAAILMANLLLLGLIGVRMSLRRRGTRLAISSLLVIVSASAIYALWKGYGA